MDGLPVDEYPVIKKIKFVELRAIKKIFNKIHSQIIQEELMKRRFSSTSKEDIRILRLKIAGNLRTKTNWKSKNIYFNNIILFYL